MGSIFNDDFRDFLLALNEADVDYILVGGYAVILHGYHRTTGDMDLWVEPTAQNHTKLMKAFTNFGMPTSFLSKDQFLDTKGYDVFSIGSSPVSIDLMTSVLGLNFSDSFKCSVLDNSQGFPIRMLHRNHLVMAKLKSGRLKDMLDIEALSYEEE